MLFLLSFSKKVVEFIHSKKDILNCELIGSWTVNVGDMDQCVHLWKYTGGFEAIDHANSVVYSDEVMSHINVVDHHSCTFSVYICDGIAGLAKIKALMNPYEFLHRIT